MKLCFYRYIAPQLKNSTDTKRNTAKTTIQSTLEYKTEINEARVKNLRKVGYMGLLNHEAVFFLRKLI